MLNRRALAYGVQLITEKLAEVAGLSPFSELDATQERIPTQQVPNALEMPFHRSNTARVRPPKIVTTR